MGTVKRGTGTSALFNTPLQATKSKQVAPPIFAMRQLLELGDGGWDPAERASAMRANYDRLVQQLNISPRGAPPSTGRLPRVPNQRAWPTGSGKKAGSKTPRSVGSEKLRLPALWGPGTSGVEAAAPSAEAEAMASVFGKLDSMRESGALSSEQAARLRKLGLLQERLAAPVAADDGAAIDAAKTLLAFSAGCVRGILQTRARTTK